MIVAKPVVPNQYWILKKDDRKIGNIEADPSGGFQVKINNQTQLFRTIRMVKQKLDVDFETIRHPKQQHTDQNQVNGYPTTGSPHNAIFDVRHQIPLWTREPRSKSWYAAGWYRVRQGRRWEIVQCPKLITLQRYQYQGPFMTYQEANEHEPAHQ